MQLVLELLKKIFVALQAVYTKQETDTALAEIDLQRVIDAQSSRNVVMNNILTIAKTPVDNVHPLLLMGDFSSRIGSVNTTTGQISGFVNETMPQSDGTFVVTNRVSGGPLELYEGGTAPNHAVSLGQLTEEAQAREQADSALDAKIEANTANDNALANVVKWQSYAAAMQSMADETTAAQIAEEFERATNEYLADPTATKEWYTSSTTESTNPHYLTPATKPIIDFNVVKASRAAVAVGSFNANTNVSIFLPNVVDFQSACYLLRNLNSPIFIGKCEKLVQGFFGASKFDQYVYLGNCDDARLAFNSTKMSANNIAATLMSLKQHKDGQLHTISFSKSPGIASTATNETFTVTDDDGTEYSLANCPIFTTDDANSTLRKSYVLAIAKKGWTVEI